MPLIATVPRSSGRAVMRWLRRNLLTLPMNAAAIMAVSVLEAAIAKGWNKRPLGGRCLDLCSPMLRRRRSSANMLGSFSDRSFARQVVAIAHVYNALGLAEDTGVEHRDGAQSAAEEEVRGD